MSWLLLQWFNSGELPLDEKPQSGHSQTYLKALFFKLKLIIIKGYDFYSLIRFGYYVHWSMQTYYCLGRKSVEINQNGVLLRKVKK